MPPDISMSSSNLEIRNDLGSQASHPTGDKVSGNLQTSPTSDQAVEPPNSPPNNYSISDSDPQARLAGHATASKANAPPASIKYRVIYQVEDEDKDDELREVEKGPYLENAPPGYEDSSDDESEEEEDENGGTVFNIMIYMGVREHLQKKKTHKKKRTKFFDEGSEIGSNRDSESESELESRRQSDAFVSDNGEISEKTEKNVFKAADGRKFKILRHDYTVMEIRSLAIIQALKAVAKYHPKIDLNGKSLSLREPYHFLLQHMQELSQFVQKTEESGKAMKLRADFDVLQTFLNAKWSKKIEKELARYQQNPPVATFEMLWMLFKPGTRVFSTDNSHLSDGRGGFIVRSMSTEAPSKQYKLSLWRFEFDGLSMFRGKVRRWIFPFDGEREIHKLETYPTELQVGTHTVQLNPELKIKLEERGEKYWTFVRRIMQRGSVEVNYDGPFGRHKKDDSGYNGRAILTARMPTDGLESRPPPPPQNIHMTSRLPGRPESRLPPPPPNNLHMAHPFFDNDNVPAYGVGDITPNSTADRLEKLTTLKKGMWYDYQHISEASLKHRNIVVGKGHFFLCPAKIGGFLLRSRTFDILDVEFAYPCVIDETVIDNLRIPRSRLEMIRGLTQKYEDKQKTWSADFIQNKGEGQIFLLHGPSGVGKTYTAECIANLTGRPLLALTVADIGTDEEDMEKSLAKWFKYSEAWEAIMLIDEADVYFERRGSGQLQRNSLVSAFLRAMEYYRGILFLTTNRLGHIDDAILSRIHLIIEYTDLSDEDRVKIWLQFFKKLETDRPNFKVDEYLEGFIENDPKIRALQWNGREIRNAFQTAVALAEYSAKTAVPPKERVIITKKHLEGVVEMSGAFKKYMRDWKGDVDRRAFIDGSRMDQGMKIRREQLEMAREAARNSRVVREKP